MMDTGEFFDKHSEFYGCFTPSKYDYFFLDFISNHTGKCNLLDIGGGGGCFTKMCKDRFQEVNLCIVDPSKSLLYKYKLDGVKLVIGKLPNELNIDEKFDYIHIQDVLHHVTGSSITESKNLLKQSLIYAQNNLNVNGYMLIHEHFYESYLIPTCTRNLIFYLLRLQNLVKIKMPVKAFILDLNVCFYTRNEFRKIFKDIGFNIVDYYEDNFVNNRFKKIGLIEKWGTMSFVVQPQTKNLSEK